MRRFSHGELGHPPGATGEAGLVWKVISMAFHPDLCLAEGPRERRSHLREDGLGNYFDTFRKPPDQLFEDRK